MLYQYLGVNYSYADLFYLSGAGYSLASRPWIGSKIWPPIPPFKPYIDPGALVSFWKQDLNFMSKLFGTNSTIIYNNSKCGINNIDAWREYWGRVKNYLKNDIPVETFIDPIVLPWWREHIPFVKDWYDKYGVNHTRNRFVGQGHYIVLVGFNESNMSVCYNDMINKSCHYIWMNISDLKDGTSYGSLCYWDDVTYITIVLENTSGSPISKEEAFRLAHERNIMKMQGWHINAYDQEYLRLYRKFGIDALKALKNDLKPIKMIPKIQMWRYISRLINLVNPIISADLFHHMNESVWWIIKERELASKSLLEFNYYNENCSFCLYDGILLKKESEKWEEFHLLIQKLTISFYNNRLLENILFSVTTLREMTDIINDIIKLEELILDGVEGINI